MTRDAKLLNYWGTMFRSTQTDTHRSDPIWSSPDMFALTKQAVT